LKMLTVYRGVKETSSHLNLANPLTYEKRLTRHSVEILFFFLAIFLQYSDFRGECRISR